MTKQLGCIQKKKSIFYFLCSKNVTSGQVTGLDETHLQADIQTDRTDAIIKIAAAGYSYLQ